MLIGHFFRKHGHTDGLDLEDVSSLTLLIGCMGQRVMFFSRTKRTSPVQFKDRIFGHCKTMRLMIAMKCSTILPYKPSSPCRIPDSGRCQYQLIAASSPGLFPSVF